MNEPPVRKATRYAYLLGEGISHSLSPAIHNAAFAALGLDYEYRLLDVPPARLQGALARMRQPDCLSGNITMPYKSDVLAAAEECSETVRGERLGEGIDPAFRRTVSGQVGDADEARG